jgi:hypothetical protein
MNVATVLIRRDIKMGRATYFMHLEYTRPRLGARASNSSRVGISRRFPPKAARKNSNVFRDLRSASCSG